MNKLKIVTAATALALSTSANAALLERLGGLAYYDDVADLTWLADANASGTTMDWATANNWAAGLTVGGKDGWRLATSDTCSGYDCTNSEMGNLFYNVLGGSAGSSIATTHNTNYDLFSNIQPTLYWTSTDSYLGEGGFNWGFNMASGEQFAASTSQRNYTWYVQTGDVSAVPVPAAVWLFSSGLIGLVSVARRNLKVKSI